MTQNVGQFLARRAYRDPRLEATYEPATGRRLTYAELNERSDQIANALSDLGIAKGDRVGLLLMNGAEFVETFFGAGKIGAVNVPLNWRLVPDELEFILTDSGCTALLFSAEFAETIAELRKRGTTPIEHWIQLEGEPAEGILGYDEIRLAASSEPATSDARGEDMLFIMYTSGTTGLPKGVIHTHDTVMWALLTISATSDFRKGDRFLNSLPMFHVGALSPVLACVYGAVSLSILKAFDPTLSWQVIKEENITTSLMVPAMLQFMAATFNPDEHDVSSLRWIMSGAAPVPVSLINTYLAMDIEIQQVYGLTETGGPACLIVADDAVNKAGSTGKAFYFTEVRVVDADNNDCAPGEPGEVLVRGPHIMEGYWNRPEATAEAIVDGWLYTGDIATMDDEGFVTIVDRVKDMLISGGENVYPAEIENVLLSNEKVADAGVIGIPSKKWGESPLAVVVRKDDNLEAEELLAYCKGKLAPFKTIKAVEFVDEIPRNPSGKILKRELREQFSYDAAE